MCHQCPEACILGRVFEYGQLTSELIREFRGRRSQRRLSSRLGHQSNVLYRWEAGTRAPTVPEFFALCRLVGRDPVSACATFDRTAYAATVGDLQEARVGAFLRKLAGAHSITRVAEVMGRNRYVVSRIWADRTVPRIPDFLQLLEAVTHRMLDFVATLVDPSTLPAAAEGWARLQTYRRLAYDHPYSEAVVALLELDFVSGAPQPTGFIAKRLGISIDEEIRILAALETAGLAVRRGLRMEPVTASRYVDTRSDAAAFAQLKRFWASEASSRLGDDNLCSYALLSISQDQLRRITEIFLESFETARAFGADPDPAERAVLLTVQLTSLDGDKVLPKRS